MREKRQGRRRSTPAGPSGFTAPIGKRISVGSEADWRPASQHYCLFPGGRRVSQPATARATACAAIRESLSCKDEGAASSIAPWTAQVQAARATHTRKIHMRRQPRMAFCYNPLSICAHSVAEFNRASVQNNTRSKPERVENGIDRFVVVRKVHQST